MKQQYCNNIFSPSRRNSRVVSIGNISIGGNHPVCVQSMTNTDTNDIDATVGQCIRMADAGCELIRITAQGVKEAKSLKLIKEELGRRGYKVPLVADIHYNPKAAEVAAEIVDKVRINPGNYVDRHSKDKIDFTEEEYKNELVRIRERLLPLLDICKEHNTAIRIGTNHGSLSQRIMSRFGDTPQGMAESAMEFVRICHEYDFYNLVLSMKASNVNVMVESTRLLASMMDSEGMNYPLHLGVTEAGDGEEGRIKSAAGIGALLADGLGDTIRVSLTEDPEKEIPVARDIVAPFAHYKLGQKTKDELSGVDSFNYKRRESQSILNIGGQKTPVVLSSELIEGSLFKPDYIVDAKCKQVQSEEGTYLYLDIKEATKEEYQNKISFVELSINKALDVFQSKYQFDKKHIIILKKEYDESIHKARRVFNRINKLQIENPVILHLDYSTKAENEFIVKVASDTALLGVDGLLDGIWITNDKIEDKEFCNKLSFKILQANGMRYSQTEYISCPSCGRTLYDIQASLAKVKEATKHLKGLKIAVMGCIVNGPGEMADADYGYVGAGPNKVCLYKGKTMVRKNVEQEKALQVLIEVIKEYGDWKEA